MTEPTLDPLVQRAMLSNDVAYEVLPCDPDMADTAAFCAHYGFAMEQAANTILVASKKVAPPKYAACVVLGTTRLDVNKKVSELLAVKRLSFADEETTLGLTGMMIGGSLRLALVICPSTSTVRSCARVVMGGGNRSSKLLLNPNELTKQPRVVVVEGLARPKRRRRP
jgi:prolyl-tRNA editing enzyme YbaK/EbsC (Cys-tRNA(Pro) deacylase)